jgi:hypothetical protein
LADDLLSGRELAASDRKSEYASQDLWNCAAVDLDAKAVLAALLQLESLPRERLVRAAQHEVQWVVQQAQPEQLALRQQAQLILLRRSV